MNVTDLAQKVNRAQANARPSISLLRKLGVHPVVALVFVIVDFLLFGGEIITWGFSLKISILAGIFLGLWAIRQQKVAYGDTLGRALIKGVALGVLTALPTPAASFLTVIGGLLPLFDKVAKEEAEREKEEGPSMRNITPPKEESDRHE